MRLKVSKYTSLIPAGSDTYLVNTLSGASTVLREAESRSVQELFVHLGDTGLVPPRQQRVSRLLVDSGFLVPEETDELAAALAKYDRGRNDPNVVSLTITTTMECNMGCYYCFEDRTSAERLETADIDAIVRFAAARLPQHGHLHITWFGGEPLLQKDFVLAASRAMIQLAEGVNAGYSATMVSNGYKLDPATARELRDHRVSGIQITLDGAKEHHDAVRRHRSDAVAGPDRKVIPIMAGNVATNMVARSAARPRRVDSYETIVENIRQAAEFLQVGVRVNVSKRNSETIRQLVNDLAGAGLAGKLASIYFAPLYNFKVTDPGKHYQPTEKVHFGMREFAELEAGLLEHAYSLGFRLRDWADPSHAGCIAVSKNGFVIDSTGEVKKCDHELGEPGTAVCSLRDPALHDEANERKWDAYRPESNPGCDTCILLPVCYSNCPHKNMVSVAGQGDKCPSHKFNWQRTLPLVLAQRAGLLANGAPDKVTFTC